jgi:hypothetical protein
MRADPFDIQMYHFITEMIFADHPEMIASDIEYNPVRPILQKIR